MAAIYTPKGRAREYAALAVNHYSGCDHGCAYCYVPGVVRRDRTEFHSAPKPRGERFWRELQRDAARMKGTEDHILLSFTGDPYCWTDVHAQATRQAIIALKEAGLHISILTKGAFRSRRDFDLLNGRDKYGASLTFWDAADSRKWEPRAADPGARMCTLKAAKAAGLQTWASIEPVLDPEQSLQLIIYASEFVDEFKIGKCNHVASLPDGLREQVVRIDWPEFRECAVALCEQLSVKYYIKHDLREAR